MLIKLDRIGFDNLVTNIWHRANTILILANNWNVQERANTSKNYFCVTLTGSNSKYYNYCKISGSIITNEDCIEWPKRDDQSQLGKMVEQS